MTGRPDQSNLKALQTRISWLWSVYIDERASDRQRRAIGAEIDRTFERVKQHPEWLAAFLATDQTGEE